ncbi:MAG: radical SAM protein [Nitrospirae bacterium]|nr:radical SAM protein [Nitrospirota bacterium]
MNCEILNTLYVKSNGDIPCNCDFGEQILLGKVAPDEPSWNILNVLTNEKYAHIRKTLASGTMPWGDICGKCAFIRGNESLTDYLAQKKIRKIQIEPSLACNLRCPCCSNQTHRKTRPKQHLMTLEVFKVLMSSLTQNSYLTESIEYCGQGDPLMHPKFVEFVKIARLYYPSAIQRLITNGNFDYCKTMNNELIEQLYVSCDGVFQGSYEKYRIGGSVDKAIKFMKDAKKSGNVRKLIWKYILFEFNDSNEELIAAQHLANSIGVDLLMFVFTHSQFKSIKYKPETISELPIIYPIVTTNHTSQIEEKNRNKRQKASLNYAIRCYKRLLGLVK